MPTVMQPKIRDFQGARENTGLYQDHTNRNVGFKLHKDAETAGKKPLVTATTKYYFLGALRTMLRGVAQ